MSTQPLISVPETSPASGGLTDDECGQQRSPAAASRPTVVVPKRNLAATLRQWHQRAGLLAFLFLGWLGVSGILLNETSDLGLNGVRIYASWIMDLYGLHTVPPQHGFFAGTHWLAVTNNATLLDGKPLNETIPSPLGLAVSGTSNSATLFVATGESLVLLSPGGKRIDELRSMMLPISTIRRIGTVKQHPDEIAVQDLDAYKSSDQGATWKRVDAQNVNWSVLTPLSSQERAQLMPFSRPSVSLQQLLVDAHSGRLFGRYGTYVIDMIGLLALVLSSSGVWMWWRTAKRRQLNRTSIAVAKNPMRK